MMTDVT